MARKHTILLLLGVALLALVVAARFIGRDTSARPDPGASSAAAEDRALPVYTHIVAAEPLSETITATGTVRAAESVDLVSELTGKVVELHFEEGSPVEAGALLVRLDDSELRAQLERAQHRVELARVEAERQRELLAAQGTSRQVYDAALNEQRVLAAEVDLIQAQLAKTELRAPFAGIVGLRYVSVGSFVNPSTRIVSLQALDELKIEFAVAERHMVRLSPDARVAISVTGLAEPLDGRVYAIEPQIDAGTRTILLRARARNPGGVLPGAFATIELTLREIPEALLVPANALVAELNRQTLFVVEDGRAAPREVTTGLRLARQVQIVSGLEPGDVVITSGQLQLQAGDAVRPVERNEPPPGAAATGTP